MSPARLLSGSLRNRLALISFAITAVAVLAVYVYVTPSLESSLRQQKVRVLRRDSDAALPGLARTVGSNVDRAGVLRAVRGAADRTGARVTLMGVTSGTAGTTLFDVGDSSPEGGAAAGARSALALEAIRTGGAVDGVEPGGRVGAVALPLFFHGAVARVALFRISLSDVLSNVALIRRKILIAGTIGLAIALVAGMLVARALSSRVRRLERTARRVARGDFGARFEVDSADELGQLAAALDDMQRQLEELDSARKRFIATASHELRTPIFSLGGFLELIQDEQLDEETRRQFVGQVREQVDRLGVLASGLLDLSRLESGSLELDPRPTDLGLLARAVTAEFVPALNQHSSRLQLRIGREPLLATCDPDRVAQVLRVLVDNAITHTRPGTNIVVTTARDDDGLVRIAVLDRGAGIPPSTLERIFDPFFTSDGVRGAGLGLALARELAERMQGSLTVSSDPGRTVFALTLPG